MDGNTGDVVSWLLSSAEPAIRLLTRRDLLGEKVAGTGEILDGAMVRALLSGQRRDGGFGVHRTSGQLVPLTQHHYLGTTRSPGHRSSTSS